MSSIHMHMQILDPRTTITTQNRSHGTLDTSTIPTIFVTLLEALENCKYPPQSEKNSVLQDK